MAARLYPILWRWHCLAGLAAAPILLAVALSGALYSFQPELERWLDADLLAVAPRGARLAVARLAAAAPADCTVTDVAIPAAPDRSVELLCAEGGRRSVFVDPYRGVPLGQRDRGRGVFAIALGLHRQLLLGQPGRLAI